MTWGKFSTKANVKKKKGGDILCFFFSNIIHDRIMVVRGMNLILLEY